MDVRASYFVCSTPRSGSTLLCEALTSTGIAGKPEEYFNVGHGPDPSKEPAWKAPLIERPLSEYLPIVFGFGATPNGVFASKLHWWHLEAMETGLIAMQGGGDVSLAERLARAFPQPRYIWITRRDKVRQAVSLFKAKQFRKWQSYMAHETGRPPVFSFELVEAGLRQIVQNEAQWARFFSDAGIAPYTVVYEDLAANYDATVRGVIAHLGLTLPDGFVFPAPRLSKQADTLSAQWVRQYYQREEARHRRRLIAGLPAVLFNGSLRNAYLMPRVRKARNAAARTLGRSARPVEAEHGDRSMVGTK